MRARRASRYGTISFRKKACKCFGGGRCEDTTPETHVVRRGIHPDLFPLSVVFGDQAVNRFQFAFG